MIVFARRASPDWRALARDYADGVPVPPERFFPFHDLRFSRDIPSLIDRWNRLAAVSYFDCRAQLCEIANHNLARVEGATRIDWTEVPTFLANRGEEPFLLFYHDDDDWFHPSLKGMLDDIETGSVDAVVFPFFRLASAVTTFSFQGVPTAAAIGRCEAFRYRYCTNNYGLTPRALARSRDLVEHTQASETAEALDFVDMQVDVVISATNKTPCSASWLFRLPDNKVEFDRYLKAYIATLKGISVPAESRWIEPPLRKTIDLFESAVA